MAQQDDWRLQGQEGYLAGVELCRRPYRRYSPSWDHDHCEFCWAKFSAAAEPADALREGYCTVDQYRWICATCFDDFKDRFAWRVVPPPSQRLPRAR